MENPTQRQPTLSHSRPSLSESFRKLTNDTFARRPAPTPLSLSSSTTAPQLPKSASLASVSVTQNPHSRLLTPSGISRSTSFFSGLNYAPRARRDGSVVRETAAADSAARNAACHAAAGGRHECPQPATQSSPVSRGSREISVKIEQRRLMQPVFPALPLSASSSNLSAPVQIHHHHYHYYHHPHPHPSSVWRTSDGSGGSGSGSSSSSSGSNSSENHQPRITFTQPERSPPRTMVPSREHIKTPVPYMKAVRGRRNSQAVPPLPPPSPSSGLRGRRVYSVGAPNRVSRFSEDFDGEGSPQGRHNTKQRILKEREEDSEQSIGAGHRSIAEQLESISEDTYPSSEADSSAADAKGRGDIGIKTLDLNLIYTSQSATYWLGRHTALSDRFRSAGLPSLDLPTPLPSSTTLPKLNLSKSVATAPQASTAPSSRRDPMHDSPERNRRVFTHLRALCATEEANQSLDEYRKQWEKRFSNGEDVDDGNGRGKARRASKSGGGGQSKLVREKRSWLEGLIGGVGRRFS